MRIAEQHMRIAEQHMWIAQQHMRIAQRAAVSAIRNPQSAMSFGERIAVAEKIGLIRGGCQRLPPIARTYRDAVDADRTVSERDAKVTRQVLHVVMRDLDPGR